MREANPTNIASNGPKYLATLGMYALRQFELAVDGKAKVIYLKPRNAPAQPYAHNRLGAIFWPDWQNAQGDPVAVVSSGSPAWEAGVRNGDILLRINDIDFQKPRRDYQASMNKIYPLYYAPPGTKLELTLKRDGKEFHATPVLRDLLGPGLDTAAVAAPATPLIK